MAKKNKKTNANTIAVNKKARHDYFIELVIAPVFTSISNTQLDAFIERAKQIYG
jgi:ribosome-associated toxin RatA of RatAB toxin-antitoxin module